MRVYEEYDTPAEKRKAQRGAKRDTPTGKATGYIFVFDENGISPNGNYDAQGHLSDSTPGANPGPMCGTNVGREYLRTRCRRVAGKRLPKAWRAVWDDLRKPEPVTAGGAA